MGNVAFSSQEEEILRVFNKQIEEDKRIVISRSNVSELHKVNSAITLQSYWYSLFCISVWFFILTTNLLALSHSN